jgi:hypothetical protein
MVVLIRKNGFCFWQKERMVDDNGGSLIKKKTLQISIAS